MLREISDTVDKEQAEFTTFALELIDHLGTHFVNLSPQNAEKCKQILFPDGFLDYADYAREKCLHSPNQLNLQISKQKIFSKFR